MMVDSVEFRLDPPQHKLNSDDAAAAAPAAAAADDDDDDNDDDVTLPYCWYCCH